MSKLWKMAVPIILSSCLLTAQAASTDSLKEPIRKNYLEVNDLVKRKQLNVIHRECPGVAPEFTLMKDRNGVVRRYVVGAGTEDSAATLQHDYNRADKLMFVLVTYGNVHGGSYEWRIYFAESGRVIDVVRSKGEAPIDEAQLWYYITPSPLLDWQSNWCP